MAVRRTRATSRGRTLIIGAALSVLGVAVTGAPARAGGTASPTLELSTTSLAPGRPITVSGAGWSPGTNLQFQLCGANAVDGATDCAPATSVVASPASNGTIDAEMTPLAPPRPCPCVVLVTSAYSTFTRRIPVTVSGVAVAPVRPIPGSGPVKVEAWVTADPSPASWFGAPAPRRLNLLLVNEGSQPISHPVISAHYRGRSGDAETIDTPTVAPIGPRQTRVVVVDFALDLLAHGDVTVTGVVSGASTPSPFAATTSTQPWGLVVVALALVQLLLLGVRNRCRARLGRRRPDLPAPPPALVPPPSVN